MMEKRRAALELWSTGGGEMPAEMADVVNNDIHNDVAGGYFYMYRSSSPKAL
jgi:hypothetical protein